MISVRVIDWQTRARSQLPGAMKGNYIRWLVAQRYDLIATEPLGNTEIEIYQAVCDTFAVYHPSFGTLDSECLFVNIPSQDEVQALVTNSQKRLEPIREIFGL